MPWRGRRGKICKSCGGHVSVVGQLSVRYKCRECGLGRMAANAIELHEHHGPFFDHWRRRCLAAFGVTVDTD